MPRKAIKKQSGTIEFSVVAPDFSIEQHKKIKEIFGKLKIEPGSEISIEQQSKIHENLIQELNIEPHVYQSILPTYLKDTGVKIDVSHPEKNLFTASVKVDKLKESINNFMQEFKDVLENLDNNDNKKFLVDTIEVGLEVHGEGSIVVAKMGASTSIKITFKRKQ